MDKLEYKYLLKDEWRKKSGIYYMQTTNNDKVYIGSAKNIYTRLTGHLSSLQKTNHHSFLLQDHYCEFGFKYFNIGVLEYVSELTDLTIREQYYFDLCGAQELISGLNKHFCDLTYNVSPTANSQLGFKHSEKSKAQMSKVRKERKPPSWNKGMIGILKRDQETKDKISNTLKGFKRGKFSEEHRKKLSESAKKRGPRNRSSYDGMGDKIKAHPNYKSNLERVIKNLTLKKMIPVSQIDPITNQEIREFDSIKSAMQFLNLKCNRGLYTSDRVGKIYKGFLWKIKRK